MKDQNDKLKKLKAELEEAVRINHDYKNSSQAIPDPDLQTKIIESAKKIEKLRVAIHKLS